jgi:predicted molibdopterin-dependent oxidoreductase YjgC
MPEITIDGRRVTVREQTSVAAAILQAGVSSFRRSVTGEPRAALCGMGICYECRVTIDGEPHALSCQTLCVDGMVVETT